MMKVTVLLIAGLLLMLNLTACSNGVYRPSPTFTETPYFPVGTPGFPYPGPAEPPPYPSPGQGSLSNPGPEQPTYPGPQQPYPAPQQPYPAPWQPQDADQSLQRDSAFVEEMDILVMESFPPQYTLKLQGTLPTPCHQARIEVAPPDSQNRILVSVYSVVDPTAICAQVLAPFEASVPLQGLPSGKYTVVVKDAVIEKEAGSIEVP